MYKNLINGEWVAGSKVSRNINPSDTRDLVGEYTQGDAAQAREAIGAAHAAFPAWSVSTPQQRFDILDAVGSEILARRADSVTCWLEKKARRCSRRSVKSHAQATSSSSSPARRCARVVK